MLPTFKNRWHNYVRLVVRFTYPRRTYREKTSLRHIGGTKPRSDRAEAPDGSKTVFKVYIVA